MRIRDPEWKKFRSGMEKFGSGIQDGKKSDPGSGIEKNIPDPQRCLVQVLEK
jgi:hypothetical protein